MLHEVFYSLKRHYFCWYSSCSTHFHHTSKSWILSDESGKKQETQRCPWV